MGFDWTTVLNDQDKSIEGLLARRDMTKQMNAQMQIAQAQEQRRHTGVQEAHQAEQLKQQAATIQESQLYRQQEAQARADRAAVDDRRAKYNTSIAGRQPGFRAGPEHMAGEREFGNPDQYEQDPNDPNMHIYLRAKAAQLQQQADTLEQTRKATEQRAKEDQARQDRDEQRRDRVEQRDIKRDADAKKEKTKDFDKLTEFEKVQVKAAAQKMLEDSATPGSWGLNGWTEPAATISAEEAEMKAMQQVINKKRAVTGQTPLQGATAVPKPTETPEQRRKRLLGG